MFRALFLVLILSFSLAAILSAQNPSSSVSQGSWTKVYDEKLNFEVTIPGKVLVDNEGQPDWFLSPVTGYMPEFIDVYMQSVLTGYYKSIGVDLRILNLRQISQAKKYLWRYVEFAYPEKPFQDFKIGDVVGRKITLDKDDRLGAYIVIAIKTKLFIFYINSKIEDKEVYEKCIKSLTLSGNILFKSNTGSLFNVKGTISLRDLKSSSEILEALSQQTIKHKFVGLESPLPGEELREFLFDKPVDNVSFSRPLIIIRRPRKFPNLQLGEKLKATVKAKVEFLKNGQIGKIQLYGEAPQNICKNIIGDIQDIKFLPAEVNGQKIDFVKVLDYSIEIR